MKIGIIGAGWRSGFFLRAAGALPEEFEVVGISRTTREKAEASQREWGVPGCVGVDGLLERKPGYVILSIPRREAGPVLETLMERGVPVLCETPPAADTAGLTRLWETQQRTHTPVLVAEQYAFQPYHSANLSLIASGALGEIVSVRNSMMHGYHGINVMRRCLGVGMQDCRITGRVDEYPVTKTCDRDGSITSGEVATARRELFRFAFEGGKAGYWDFSNEQYFSYIRARHFSVEGTRGEICDTTVRLLDERNEAHELLYRRVEAGPYSNLEGDYLRAMELGGRTLWRSPFPGARLCDDEIAVAHLMRNLREQVECGAPSCYPFAEALQDSYLSFCLDEAMKTGGVTGTKQAWAKP